MTAQQQLAESVPSRIERALESSGWLNCDPDDWEAVKALIYEAGVRVDSSKKHMKIYRLIDADGQQVGEKMYPYWARAKTAAEYRLAAALRRARGEA